MVAKENDAMKILFTSPILEHPAAGGPALRIENSIKALACICDLYIISRASGIAMSGKKAESFYRGLCRDFWFAPSARLSVNKYVRKIQKEWRKAWHFQSDVRFIVDLVDKNHIDVLWCGFGNISFELIYKIKTLCPRLKIVCDTDSVWSRFVFRELPFEGDPKRLQKIEREGCRVEAWERKIVNLCEVTTAVSEVDAQYYRGIAEQPDRVMTFSNVIDLQTYAQIPSPVAGLKKPCIYLAGTFGHPHSPMDRAARWIIEEVLPLVKQEIPNVHFYMVGRNSQVVWGGLNDPAITVTGKVPSVLPYLCYADVAVVPLQFESGTRFKILEAGACRIPIVSTTLGAEGLPLAHGQEILLADTPKDFAKSIIKLIKDKILAGQLGLNCQKLVKKRFSVEYLMTEAQRILEILVSDNNRE